MAYSLMAIVHVPGSVSHGAQRDRLPDEGAANEELLTAKMDEPFLLNLTHLIARGVLEGWQLGRERPRTRLVAGRWRCVPQRLVRSTQIVDVAPGVEGALHLVQALPGRAPSQHFQPQGAMEAFLFALRLGMARPSMQHGHAQADEPGRELGVRVGGVAAPGRAVVHEHAFRKPVALAGLRPFVLDRLRSPVPARGAGG